MGFFRWLRRLLGGRSAQPDTRPEKVMHLAVGWPTYHAACGAAWTPANPLTIELKFVDCARCRWLGQRDRIQRHATRR